MPEEQTEVGHAGYYATTPDQEICEIVVTAPDAAWLADLTRQLIELRHAASAHLIPEVRSLYRWQGEIVEAAEARVAIRTRRSAFEAILALVQKSHPYVEPSVTMLPITASSQGYRAWLLGETMTDP